VSAEELTVLKAWIAGGAPEFPSEDPQHPTPPVVPRSELAAEVYGIFREKCHMCHRVADAKGGIRILNHNLLLQRLVLIPGRPDESEVYDLLVTTDPKKPKMPPDDSEAGPMTKEETEKVRQWIAEGAPPFPHVPKKK
jgi:hypothetical protein